MTNPVILRKNDKKVENQIKTTILSELQNNEEQ